MAGRYNSRTSQVGTESKQTLQVSGFYYETKLTSFSLRFYWKTGLKHNNLKIKSFPSNEQLENEEYLASSGKLYVVLIYLWRDIQDIYMYILL